MFQEKFQKDIAIDSGALQRRLALNRQLGTYDFDSWVLTRLQPKQREYILDIGYRTEQYISENCQVWNRSR